MRRSVLAALALAIVPASAQAVTDSGRIGAADGNFDVRNARDVSPADPAAVAALRTSLGANALVSVDGRNGALRMVGRLDGTLTGPSSADPAGIAIAYVRAHRAAFGLSLADVGNLVLVRRVKSGNGLQRLFWQQRAGSVPALDSGLRANFTADGRLINLAGSPVGGLGAVRVAPRLNGAQARAAALDGLGVAARPALARPSSDARSTTTFASGDRAALGVLAGATKRVVWDTTVKVDNAHAYRVVVDAASGRTLLRRNLVQNAAGLVHKYYPGATNGGAQSSVDFTANGWLDASPANLSGPNVHAFSDIDDDDFADVAEEVPPVSGNFNFNLLTPADFGTPPCGTGLGEFTCTWDPTDGSSAIATRTDNRQQATTQAFFFVNNFHDWLAQAPFSFTSANGAFEISDPVIAQALDGASLVDDSEGDAVFAHTDNANMSTPPDGQSPTMQMYLFHVPGRVIDSFANGGDPFLPSNGGDAADILYHEYTHGLSNRLVIDSLGNSTLNSAQSAAMGEAWSDWYAMDYLADTASCNPVACEPDTAADGELLLGKYVSIGGAGADAIRFQAIDCPVGAVASLCASPNVDVPDGGFTYASFGKILGFPEVHADGEIWAQTLWDLRDTLGKATTRMLVTRAMELAPDDPSFLDMRNAILQADATLNAGAAETDIWTVFANRGMGFFAGAVDSNDTAPVASFALPPAANAPKGTVSGTVIDVDTHAPVSGIRVGIRGLDSLFAGDPGATTNPAGVYSLPAFFAGNYPYFVARGAGYESATVSPFAITAGAKTQNLAPRRGWALSSGGGQVVAFTGADNTQFGCGPGGLIDGSLGTGWGSDLFLGAPTITVQLPATINITGFGIDPGATCGDDADAGTQGMTIETSPDGVTFTQALAHTFLLTDGGHVNELAPTAASTNVRYVRLTSLSNFGNINDFVDVSELQVHGFQPGNSTAVITGPATIQLGKTAVYSSASSAGLAGSPITTRTWTQAGVPNGTGVTFPVKGVKRGPLTINLAVADFVHRTGTTSKAVTVIDTLGPDVTMKNVSGRVKKSVTITAKISDPSGLAKNAKATVKFGDGKSASVTIKKGKISVKHTYKKAKTFTVTVTVKDKLRNTSRTTAKATIKKAKKKK